jgi:hypothetical protein
MLPLPAAVATDVATEMATGWKLQVRTLASGCGSAKKRVATVTTFREVEGALGMRFCIPALRLQERTEGTYPLGGNNGNSGNKRGLSDPISTRYDVTVRWQRSGNGWQRVATPIHTVKVLTRLLSNATEGMVLELRIEARRGCTFGCRCLLSRLRVDLPGGRA